MYICCRVNADVQDNTLVNGSTGKLAINTCDYR
jgi:hypothetical protein